MLAYSGHSWAEHNAADRLETRPPPPPHGTSGSSYAQSSAPNTQNVGNLLFMAGNSNISSLIESSKI